MRIPVRLALSVMAVLATPAAMAQDAAVPPEPTNEVAVLQVHVATNGDDRGDGTAAHPVKSLARAQEVARAHIADSNVEVLIKGGVYALARPLDFREADSAPGHSLVWKAAGDARPVISGGMPVTGWKPSKLGHGIWEASVPAGTVSRQLWVNDRMAQIAETDLPRDAVTFSETGMTIAKGVVPALEKIKDAPHLEVEGTGYFTDRFSPVESIAGRELVMRQPAWGNNNWGYDTLAVPLGDEHARLYLRNALPFLDEPGEWYLDSRAGRLFYMPAKGVDMKTAKVVLPRLEYLVSISGRYDKPVRDIRFEGLQFSYTSWLGPNSDQGYANQQSGSFMTGSLDARPADAIKSCVWGCPGFETRRNEWSQMPAAIQVSAAERIGFHRNIFAHLGQIALGIGNNDDANASGIGLGTAAIEVSENLFTDLAGGAIMAGGIQRAAHHPETPAQANRALVVQNNRISHVSQDFMDNSAILATYVDGALILHNDISNAPYDAIDIGWGWGLNDPGGNPTYRISARRYYDFPENLVYETPTTHRDVVVAYNRVHAVKQHYQDGGAIYNLSASPGTVIAENYLYDIAERIALYLDEGSRYITVRNNVVNANTWWWLNANTIDAFAPQRITIDNRAIGNWHNREPYGGKWTAYQNNLILDDHLVEDGKWPEEARKIMENAGIQKSAEIPAYRPAAPAE